MDNCNFHFHSEATSAGSGLLLLSRPGHSTATKNGFVLLEPSTSLPAGVLARMIIQLLFMEQSLIVPSSANNDLDTTENSTDQLLLYG